MLKKLALMTMAATILSATPAYAGQWMQDGNGWWWQNDNGSYPAFTWAWCDGNHDGIGENYFFDENGYMSMDTAAQEIAVNENGAMLYNGAVCTAAMPDGQDFVPGMAIDGKLVYWVYQESDASIAADKEREHKKTEQESFENIDSYELAYRIAELVNEERESRGKEALEINEELMENAMLRAGEAVESFSHTRPNGENYDTAVTIEYSLAGENLAGTSVHYGSTLESLAEETVDGWLKSSGHKKNLLDSKWEETGVGVYKTGGGEYTISYRVIQIFIKK